MPRQVATERESNKPGVIGASALVGRSAEMAALTRVFASPPAVVAVEGEAGIGKSRLISEFLASSGAPQRFLLACCPPYREPHTLGAVVDAVRQAALDVTRLPLNGLGGALRSLFPEWAGQLPPPMESAEDATAARHRLFQALMELLRCLDVALRGLCRLSLRRLGRRSVPATQLGGLPALERRLMEDRCCARPAGVRAGLRHLRYGGTGPKDVWAAGTVVNFGDGSVENAEIDHLSCA